jgi:hypothetical protein
MVAGATEAARTETKSGNGSRAQSTVTPGGDFPWNGPERQMDSPGVNTGCSRGADGEPALA